MSLEEPRASHGLYPTMSDAHTYHTLEKLHNDLDRMETQSQQMLQYKSKVDQLKQEKVSLAMTYENNMRKYQAHINSLERENMLLLNEVKKLESHLSHSEDREKCDVLLEQLSTLNTQNNSLAMENQAQRHQYDKCLDDIANQVVTALLGQKTLQEECNKLKERVQELEIQNDQLSCLFQHQMRMSTESVMQLQCRSGMTSPHRVDHPGFGKSTQSIRSMCSDYQAYEDINPPTKPPSISGSHSSLSPASSSVPHSPRNSRILQRASLNEHFRMKIETEFPASKDSIPKMTHIMESVGVNNHVNSSSSPKCGRRHENVSYIANSSANSLCNVNVDNQNSSVKSLCIDTSVINSLKNSNLTENCLSINTNSIPLCKDPCNINTATLQTKTENVVNSTNLCSDNQSQNTNKLNNKLLIPPQTRNIKTPSTTKMGSSPVLKRRPYLSVFQETPVKNRHDRLSCSEITATSPKSTSQITRCNSMNSRRISGNTPPRGLNGKTRSKTDDSSPPIEDSDDDSDSVAPGYATSTFSLNDLLDNSMDSAQESFYEDEIDVGDDLSDNHIYTTIPSQCLSSTLTTSTFSQHSGIFFTSTPTNEKPPDIISESYTPEQSTDLTLSMTSSNHRPRSLRLGCRTLTMTKTKDKVMANSDKNDETNPSNKDCVFKERLSSETDPDSPVDSRRSSKRLSLVVENSTKVEHVETNRNNTLPCKQKTQAMNKTTSENSPDIYNEQNTPDCCISDTSSTNTLTNGTVFSSSSSPYTTVFYNKYKINRDKSIEQIHDESIHDSMHDSSEPTVVSTMDSIVQTTPNMMSSDSSCESIRAERSGSKDDGYSTMSSDVHPEIMEKLSDSSCGSGTRHFSGRSEGSDTEISPASHHNSPQEKKKFDGHSFIGKLMSPLFQRKFGSSTSQKSQKTSGKNNGKLTSIPSFTQKKSVSTGNKNVTSSKVSGISHENDVVKGINVQDSRIAGKHKNKSLVDGNTRKLDVLKELSDFSDGKMETSCNESDDSRAKSVKSKQISTKNVTSNHGANPSSKSQRNVGKHLLQKPISQLTSSTSVNNEKNQPTSVNISAQNVDLPRESNSSNTSLNVSKNMSNTSLNIPQNTSNTSLNISHDTSLAMSLSSNSGRPVNTESSNKNNISHSDQQKCQEILNIYIPSYTVSNPAAKNIENTVKEKSQNENTRKKSPVNKAHSFLKQPTNIKTKPGKVSNEIQKPNTDKDGGIKHDSKISESKIPSTGLKSPKPNTRLLSPLVTPTYTNTESHHAMKFQFPPKSMTSSINNSQDSSNHEMLTKSTKSGLKVDNSDRKQKTSNKPNIPSSSQPVKNEIMQKSIESKTAKIPTLKPPDKPKKPDPEIHETKILHKASKSFEFTSKPPDIYLKNSPLTKSSDQPISNKKSNLPSPRSVSSIPLNPFNRKSSDIKRNQAESSDIKRNQPEIKSKPDVKAKPSINLKPIELNLKPVEGNLKTTEGRLKSPDVKPKTPPPVPPRTISIPSFPKTNLIKFSENSSKLTASQSDSVKISENSCQKSCVPKSDPKKTTNTFYKPFVPTFEPSKGNEISYKPTFVKPDSLKIHDYATKIHPESAKTLVDNSYNQTTSKNVVRTESIKSKLPVFGEVKVSTKQNTPTCKLPGPPIIAPKPKRNSISSPEHCTSPMSHVSSEIYSHAENYTSPKSTTAHVKPTSHQIISNNVKQSVKNLTSVQLPCVSKIPENTLTKTDRTPVTYCTDKQSLSITQHNSFGFKKPMPDIKQNSFGFNKPTNTDSIRTSDKIKSAVKNSCNERIISPRVQHTRMTTLRKFISRSEPLLSDSTTLRSSTKITFRRSVSFSILVGSDSTNTGDFERRAFQKVVRQKWAQEKDRDTDDLYNMSSESESESGVIRRSSPRKRTRPHSACLYSQGTSSNNFDLKRLSYCETSHQTTSHSSTNQTCLLSQNHTSDHDDTVIISQIQDSSFENESGVDNLFNEEFYSLCRVESNRSLYSDGGSFGSLNNIGLDRDTFVKGVTFDSRVEGDYENGAKNLNNGALDGVNELHNDVQSGVQNLHNDGVQRGGQNLHIGMENGVVNDRGSIHRISTNLDDIYNLGQQNFISKQMGKNRTKSYGLKQKYSKTDTQNITTDSNCDVTKQFTHKTDSCGLGFHDCNFLHDNDKTSESSTVYQDKCTNSHNQNSAQKDNKNNLKILINNHNNHFSDEYDNNYEDVISYNENSNHSNRTKNDCFHPKFSEITYNPPQSKHANNFSETNPLQSDISNNLSQTTYDMKSSVSKSTNKQNSHDSHDHISLDKPPTTPVHISNFDELHTSLSEHHTSLSELHTSLSSLTSECGSSSNESLHHIDNIYQSNQLSRHRRKSDDFHWENDEEMIYLSPYSSEILSNDGSPILADIDAYEWPSELPYDSFDVDYHSQLHDFSEQTDLLDEMVSRSLVHREGLLTKAEVT